MEEKQVFIKLLKKFLKLINSPVLLMLILVKKKKKSV